jgi:cyclophilin family peptidyl-prolyl cis-trans isomerase
VALICVDATPRVFVTRVVIGVATVSRHSRAGVVTMANSGGDSNSSVFCITTKPMPHLGAVVVGVSVAASFLFCNGPRA